MNNLKTFEKTNLLEINYISYILIVEGIRNALDNVLCSTRQAR